MKNIAIKPEDYTILAVDDIATNIMLLKAVLSRAKYKIVTASGGYEAIEKASKEAPDLILLDIMMPDLDGYEVIKHLKADPATQDIPVIFLTALHATRCIRSSPTTCARPSGRSRWSSTCS